MTRFARAKGSKSSNERVPEQATSWSEMRRGLHRESVRKAAEEQIERDSHCEHQQNLKTNVPLTSALRAKVKEPAELVPFDDVPRFGGPSLEITAEPRNSVVKKAPKKFCSQGVSKKKSLCDPQKSFVKNKLKMSQCGTRLDQSVMLENLLNGSSSVQISEPVLSDGPIKSKDIQSKTNSQSDIRKPILPTSNKQKFLNQNKLSREKGEGDSEPKIGGNFKGYPVPVEDAETLTDAYNILRKEGLTHKQAMERIKPERRRAEKRLARLMSTICFRCRKPGHRLSDCPMGDINCDVCFKCGATTHKYQDCKKKGSFVNAKCFICGVVGHLSAQCPENTHGVYPEGGECKICGEKTHLVKDCPQNKSKKDHHPGTTEFDDYFDDEKPSKAVEPKRKKIKKVQF